MKKSIAVILASATLLTAPAFAQNPQPADATAVNDLLATMRYRETAATLIEQMGEQMPLVVVKILTEMIGGDPRFTDKEKKKLMAKVDKAFPVIMRSADKLLTDPALADQLVSEIAPVYAARFTTDEIRELRAFYATPLGQKMLSSMPGQGEAAYLVKGMLVPYTYRIVGEIRQGIGYR